MKKQKLKNTSGSGHFRKSLIFPLGTNKLDSDWKN